MTTKSTRRTIRIEFGKNAVAIVALVGLYAVIVLGVALGQPETVKPLVDLLGEMIDAVKPSIDALVVGGGIAGAAGYGMRQVVKNSGK